MAAARRAPPRSGIAGFTLVEVFLTLAILGIAIFPLIETVRRAQSDAYDARLSTLCTGKIRGLISKITSGEKPGATGSGDLSTLGEDEGFDKRDAYANIKYEWQVQSVDLSLDMTPTNELTDDQKADQQKKKDNQEKASKDEAADAAIDERFRARYVRVSFTYHLESGDERQIVVETYVPPLPLDKTNGSDLVPPNNGSGSSGAKG